MQLINIIDSNLRFLRDCGWETRMVCDGGGECPSLLWEGASHFRSDWEQELLLQLWLLPVTTSLHHRPRIFKGVPLNPSHKPAPNPWPGLKGSEFCGTD